jgi:hypothetical protein
MQMDETHVLDHSTHGKTPLEPAAIIDHAAAPVERGPASINSLDAAAASSDRRNRPDGLCDHEKRRQECPEGGELDEIGQDETKHETLPDQRCG